MFTIVLEGNLNILYKRYVNRKVNENNEELYPQVLFQRHLNEIEVNKELEEFKKIK